MKVIAALVLGILITGSAAAGSDGVDRWSKWEHSSRWGDADAQTRSTGDLAAAHPNSEHLAEQWDAYRERTAAMLVKMDGKRGERRGQRRLHPDLNSGVCDDLADATPGLLELCVAFCELQDCKPDFSLDNPYEHCSASSVDALAAYEARRGAGDPDMPCVQQPDTSIECPCWSVNELAELRNPLETDVFQVCFQNASSPGNFTNYDSWQIVGGDYETSLSATQWSDAEGAGTCQLWDSCADGACLDDNRYQRVTAEQFASCEADLELAALNRGMECINLGN